MRIFLSYSSKNNFEAFALRNWLNENGWDDVALQYDPDQDARAGDRSRRTLQENVARCEAVIFLVSRDWLDSQERRDEYEFARKVDKAVFVVLIEKLAFDPQSFGLQEPQGLMSLVSGEDGRSFCALPVDGREERRMSFSVEGLGQLKAKLRRFGIDPCFFDWPPRGDPERAPYRGLAPFDAVDAGIFFGREAPLIEALDVLRDLAKAPTPRLFVGTRGLGSREIIIPARGPVAQAGARRRSFPAIAHRAPRACGDERRRWIRRRARRRRRESRLRDERGANPRDARGRRGRAAAIAERPGGARRRGCGQLDAADAGRHDRSGGGIVSRGRRPRRRETVGVAAGSRDDGRSRRRRCFCDTLGLGTMLWRKRKRSKAYGNASFR